MPSHRHRLSNICSISYAVQDGARDTDTRWHCRAGARRRDRLADLAGRLTYAGWTALVVEADITDPEQATQAVEDLVGELGRLDIV